MATGGLGGDAMPSILCGGPGTPISGADKTIYSAGSAGAALAGANAQVQTDADRDANGAALLYTCQPPPPPSDCRTCKRYVSQATTTPTGQPKVTHYSLINIFSQILGGNADYTATVDFTWTAVVTCSCEG